MDLFELVAKIRLDSSEYESGIGKAKGTFSKLASGVKTGLTTVAKVGGAAIAAGVAGVTALTKMGVEGYAQYEQLAGGAQKIFNDMDFSRIAADANNAYKELGLSANQYLAVINDVGATFAATMGDEAGYEAAKTGLKAISDYASGTGKNVDELSQKFTLITRSTSSYQSIADQFSGILPATSAGFLEQAQAAGILSDSYTQLTEVPIDKYQAAVSQMLEQGVKDLGLYNNTMDEAFSTLSGSLSMTKAAWQNLITGMADPDADIGVLIDNMVTSAGAAARQLIPAITRTLEGIGDAITRLAPVIAEAIPMLVETVLPSLLTAGVSLITSIVQGVVMALPALYTALLEAVQMILVEVFGVSEQKAGEFADGINSFFTSIKDGFIALVELAYTEGTLLNQLWLGIQTVFEIVKDALTIAFEAVSAAFMLCAEQINSDGTWLNETWTSIQDAVQALFDFVSAAFDAVSAAFKWCVDQINTEGTYLNTVWENMKAVVAAVWEYIQDLITTVIDVIENLFKAFTSVLKGDWSAAWDAIKNIVKAGLDYMKNMVSTVLNLVKNIVSNSWNFIKSNTSDIWNGIKTVISSVWDGIKSTVSSAIDNVKSKISTGLETAKNTVSRVLDTIKGKFSDIFEGAKKIVTDAIEAIKGAFDFEWSLPDLKLPHISVYGGKAPYGIGGKGSLPSFSIEWYKKAYDNAMILSNPTIFGYSDGKFLGGGDGNGNEIVAGESYLMRLISSAVEVKNEKIVALLGALLEATVDGNTETVRALMADRTFSVGEREFARLVKQYA